MALRDLLASWPALRRLRESDPLGLVPRIDEAEHVVQSILCAGEVCLPFAVFKPGFQSARNPKYTVKPQRERADRDGTEVTTKP